MANFVETSVVTAIEAFKEGWSLLKGFKFWFFILFILQCLFYSAYSVTYLIMIVEPQLGNFIDQHKGSTSNDNPLANFHMNILEIPISTFVSFVLIALVLFCFITFLTAMLEMLAIRKAMGLPSRISLAFQECKKASVNIFALSVIMTLLTQFIFLVDGLPDVLPFIKTILKITEFYINLSLSFFALPLIVIKPETGFTAAIKTSIQTMNSKWLTIVLFFAIGMMMSIIGVLTLFIGYICLIPLAYLAYGVIARDAFQLPKAPRVQI